MDRLRSLWETVQDQFESMTPRDRTLATALLAAITLLMVGGLTYTLKRTLGDLAADVIAAKADLARVQTMSGEYTVVKARLDAAEERMGQFRSNQINTYLEDWAKNASMLPMLKEVREAGTSTVGRFRERDYRVEIDDAELAAVVHFLYAIETSPYPIRVKNAKFKANGQLEQRKLDVALELVTYDKPEGGG